MVLLIIVWAVVIGFSGTSTRKEIHFFDHRLALVHGILMTACAIGATGIAVAEKVAGA
jgi:hypothetical protein